MALALILKDSIAALIALPLLMYPFFAFCFILGTCHQFKNSVTLLCSFRDASLRYTRLPRMAMFPVYGLFFQAEKR